MLRIKKSESVDQSQPITGPKEEVSACEFILYDQET